MLLYGDCNLSQSQIDFSHANRVKIRLAKSRPVTPAIYEVDGIPCYKRHSRVRVRFSRLGLGLEYYNY